LNVNSIYAQADSAERNSYFKLDLNYLSNSVYFGRKDSLVVPYLRPSITYNDKSGVFITAGLAILLSSKEATRFDLFNVDGGYNFSLGKIYAGIYASKFFYSKASYAVNSELKGMSGFYLGYNANIITIGTGGNLLFSLNTDVGGYFNLSHTFEKGGENKYWTLTPTAQVNAGTQYFNEAYYEIRKFPFTSGGNNNGTGKGKGKGHSNSNNNGSSIMAPAKTVNYYDKNKFTILDYEFSLPINYQAEKWGIYTTPVVAFPVNPASYTIDNVLQKEKISTTFYVEIGTYLKF
jgi:hypothetical protein